jgi:putative ABC transport system permease protein
VPQLANIPGGPPPQNLTDADASALQKAPDVATITPAATGSTTGAATSPVLVETSAIKFRSATIVGTTENWADTNNRDLTAGTFFDEAQVRSTARVVILGPTVASTLFGADRAAALGQTVRIDHEPFRVIGVMQTYGQQLDNTAVMPLSTARRYIFGHGIGTGTTLNQIIVQAPQQAAVPAAMDEVTRILDARHHIKDPRLRDFQIQSLGHRLQTFNQIVRILTLFTPAVAVLSLIVGGIGVLNIMLVSVTERTREIGIRKAIGATRRAIFEQFLIESTALAGLGGILGVGVGIGLSFLVGTIAPIFDPSSALSPGSPPSYLSSPWWCRSRSASRSDSSPAATRPTVQHGYAPSKPSDTSNTLRSPLRPRVHIGGANRLLRCPPPPPR